MRTKVCVLLIFGFLLLGFSKAEASITWTTDYFDYNVTDAGGYYFNWGTGLILLGASSDKSQAGGDSENSDVAAAVEPQQGVGVPGLNMASGAWGNSFQDLTQDSGGATVYAYADNTYALDNYIGVYQNGQSVSSYIERFFTVDSSKTYTLSASALAPLTWTGTTSGTAAAPQPDLTGWVYLTQTDTDGLTTVVQSFSLSTLLGSSRQASVPLVSGDLYQLVVALCNVSDLGGEDKPAGIVTSFNNLGSYYGNSLGNIDGDFNVGTQSNPVTVTASLSPAIVPPPPWWQQGAVDLGSDWWWSWFGYYYASTSNPWMYSQTFGWLYPAGTSADSLWFYDPQWDGQGGWWWTSDSVFPWIYSLTDGTWFFYDADKTDARWFYNWSTKAWETH